MEKFKNLKLSEKIRYIFGTIFILSGFGSICLGEIPFLVGLLLCVCPQIARIPRIQ